MNMKKKLLTPLALLVAGVALFTYNNAAHAAGGDAEGNWMTDFEAAQTAAQEKGLPMLIDFTGSDWCGWCIKLDREVFTHAEFVDYANSNLVLVEIDFPRDKEQSDELKAQNEALAEKYGIRGFPTIVLLSSDGELIDKTGYRPGGPGKYVAHLKELLAGG